MTASASPVAPVPAAPSVLVLAVPTAPAPSVPVVPLPATLEAPIPGNFGTLSFSFLLHPPFFFFCKSFLPTSSYTLSLHDALPISGTEGAVGIGATGAAGAVIPMPAAISEIGRAHV